MGIRRNKRDGRTTRETIFMDAGVRRWCFFRFETLEVSKPAIGSQNDVKKCFSMNMMVDLAVREKKIQCCDHLYVFASFNGIISIHRTNWGHHMACSYVLLGAKR